MLGAIFRIDEVRFDDEKEMWMIKLTMCSEHENELSDEFDYYQQQMRKHIGLASLGNLMERMGEYDKARVFYNRDLEEDPNSSVSYTGLGSGARERGEIDMALEYYSKAHEMNLKTLSAHHPNIGTNYVNLGTAYYDKGLYDKALKYDEKALNIYSKAYGEEHANVASVYQNMGVAYDEKHRYEMALQYYKKCLCIREKVLPKHHPDIALTHNSMGNTYTNLNDHQSALTSQEKAHAIYLKSLPPNHADLDQIRANRTCDCGRIHQKSALSNTHPDVGDTYFNIGLVYKVLEEYRVVLHRSIEGVQFIFTQN
ncbi:unnamed protein product [Didymodactylos carnosus]|uniref:Kinesin light chain n=1 Tax=Didymodactylos carnosus TaxID=1234261 RepID=A0A8S2EZX2_9BILA|nr:unnamed protein product [Didymodactylos carnosus]CAF4151976.1 unnamed protein product [Didymodactylos carnosus]